MGTMRCRTIVEEDGVKNIVWFGSYGKTVIAEKQVFRMNANSGIVSFSNTVANQSFNLTYKSTGMARFTFTDAWFRTLDEYTSTRPGYYSIAGVFPTPLYRMTFTGSFEEKPVLILNEYALSKPCGERIINDPNFPIGQQQVESNFSSGLQAIADDLTQKLSVMRTELWHSMNFGLPLLDKIKNKALIDSAVANLVLKQPDVNSILSFNSQILQKNYSCDLEVQTSVGNINISI